MRAAETLHAWADAHPRWAVAIIVGVTLLVLYVGFRWWTRWVERRCLAIMEGQHEALVERHVEAANQEIRDTAREILEDVRERRLPLQIVAGTPEDAADLRTLLENGHVTIGTVGVDVYPDGRRIPMSRRRRPKEEAPTNRDDVPTAWARILADDPDEEVAPCPTNQAETAKKPKPRKLPKPKPPKMV